MLPDCEVLESEKERQICGQEKMVDFIEKYQKYPIAARENKINLPVKFKLKNKN